MFVKSPWARTAGAALTTLSIATLTACGGGASTTGSAAAMADTYAVSFDLDTGAAEVGNEASAAASATLPDAAAAEVALPAFHVAPLLLDAPGETDAIDGTASARLRPHTQAVPEAYARLSTKGLTVQALQRARLASTLAYRASGNDGMATAAAAGNNVVTYTPAQIRAAYGLPALPAAGATLTASQYAALGAGQTLYIVDAKHDPNVVAELAAFNAKFGLPACVTQAIPVTAALPLATPSATSGCTFSVAYSTTAGTMSASVPGYDAGWATEIALDVQWAHATAPLARIILIEAADASLNSLLGAIKLANAMGPGVVSMSFGSPESSWTALVDATFAAPGMSYLAASGDSGAAVMWPAVSQKVLAVGGTTLNYQASGNRSEVAWSSAGGGISAYTATPAYQSNTVPGMGTAARRAVADVAFNANPASGQYVAVMPSGSSAMNWLSVGAPACRRRNGPA